MKAEIIPVGKEILLGNTIDTNSSFLANQLPLLGAYGKESTQLAKAMAEAARRTLNTDVGMSVSGNMNADSSVVVAFVSFSSDRSEQTFTNQLRENLSRMKQRAVHAAVFDLRRMLLEEV